MADDFEPAVVDNGDVAVEEKVKRPRKNYNVSPEEFVNTWEQSSSAQEVADKLGMKKNIVLARKAVYVNKGVHLKKMERKSPRKLDVDKLNALTTSTTPVVAE